MLERAQGAARRREDSADAYYPFAFGTMAPLTRPDPKNAAPDAERTAQDPAEGPVSTLRGAGARIDVHTVTRVALGVVVATLAVLVVVFVIVGFDKNQQINELRAQGVPVTFTVTNCHGLLGGSGSNGAGYACRGTYRLQGHTYDEPLPGTAFFTPGATVHAIAVPNDPGLVSPATIVESEHASWKVYIVPVVLFAALVLVVGAIVLRRRARPGPTQRG